MCIIQAKGAVKRFGDTEELVHAFITPTVDCCNSSCKKQTPKNSLKTLQLIQNIRS